MDVLRQEVKSGYELQQEAVMCRPGGALTHFTADTEPELLSPLSAAFTVNTEETDGNL